MHFIAGEYSVNGYTDAKPAVAVPEVYSGMEWKCGINRDTDNIPDSLDCYIIPDPTNSPGTHPLNVWCDCPVGNDRLIECKVTFIQTSTGPSLGQKGSGDCHVTVSPGIQEAASNTANTVNARGTCNIGTEYSGWTYAPVCGGVVWIPTIEYGVSCNGCQLSSPQGKDSTAQASVKCDSCTNDVNGQPVWCNGDYSGVFGSQITTLAPIGATATVFPTQQSPDSGPQYQLSAFGAATAVNAPAKPSQMASGAVLPGTFTGGCDLTQNLGYDQNGTPNHPCYSYDIFSDLGYVYFPATCATSGYSGATDEVEMTCAVSGDVNYATCECSSNAYTGLFGTVRCAGVCSQGIQSSYYSLRANADNTSDVPSAGNSSIHTTGFAIAFSITATILAVVGLLAYKVHRRTRAVSPEITAPVTEQREPILASKEAGASV